MIGEGPNRFPEQEWNGLALSELARSADEPLDGPARNGYQIDAASDVEPVIRAPAADLERYAGSFLAGDLQPFLDLRAPQTAGRPEPTMPMVLASFAAGVARAYARVALILAGVTVVGVWPLVRRLGRAARGYHR